MFPFPTQTLSFHCSKVKRKHLVHQFKKWIWEVGRQNLRDNYRLKWGILGFNLPASQYRLFKILLVPFWFVRFFLCLFENVLFVVDFFVVDILTAELMRWRNSWLVVCNMQQIQFNISYAYPVSNKLTEIYRPLLVKTHLCWPCDWKCVAQVQIYSVFSSKLLPIIPFIVPEVIISRAHCDTS